MLDCVICDYFIEEPDEIAKRIGVCGPVCQEVLELRAEVERLRSLLDEHRMADRLQTSEVFHD